MAEWAELHRLSGLAMRAVVDHLFWVGATISSCCSAYQRCQEVGVHRGCTDGSCPFKTYWAKMEATDIATRGPPRGQDSPKHYFEEVLEGARLIEARFSKNTMFQWHVS